MAGSQQLHPRIDLATRLSQPSRVDLDAHAGSGQPSGEACVDLRLIADRAVAELLDQVGVANGVEQAGFGRRADVLEVARVQCIDVPRVEATEIAAVVK